MKFCSHLVKSLEISIFPQISADIYELVLKNLLIFAYSHTYSYVNVLITQFSSHCITVSVVNGDYIVHTTAFIRLMHTLSIRVRN